MNSMSHISAPNLCAMATPSPVETDGFVVARCNIPDPPDAKTTQRDESV